MKDDERTQDDGKHAERNGDEDEYGYAYSAIVLLDFDYMIV